MVQHLVGIAFAFAMSDFSFLASKDSCSLRNPLHIHIFIERLQIPTYLLTLELYFSMTQTPHNCEYGRYSFFQMTDEEILTMLSERNGGLDLDHIPLALKPER